MDLKSILNQLKKKVDQGLSGLSTGAANFGGQINQTASQVQRTPQFQAAQNVANFRPIAQGPTIGQAVSTMVKPPMFGTPILNPFEAPLQKFAQDYAKGQVVGPAQQGIRDIRSPGLLNKGLGAAQLFGAGFSATPAGIAWNAGFGGAAGLAKGLRTGQDLRQTVYQAATKPTGFVGEGLGADQLPYVGPAVSVLGDVALTHSFSKGARGISALRSLSKERIHPDDAKEAIGAIDRLLYGVGNDLPGRQNMGRNQQAYVLTQLKKDEELIRGMAENYGIKLGKKARIEDVAQELYNRINVDYNRPQMNALVGKGQTPELKINKIKELENQVANETAQGQAVAESAREVRDQFTSETIAQINKLKQLAKAKVYSEGGDVESLRRNVKNPKTVTQALESVKEAVPSLKEATDDEILNYALTIPTKQETIASKPAALFKLKQLKKELSAEEKAWQSEFGRPATPAEQKRLTDEWSKAFRTNTDQPNPNAYNATAQPKTVQNLKVRDVKNEERAARADFAQWQKALFQQEGATQTTGQALNKATQAIKQNTGTPLASEVEGLKDISGFQGKARDIYRNFKEVFGGRYNQAKELILDPFDQAKGRFVDDNRLWANKVANFEKQYGIKKGSAESAAVQEFGEKQRDVLSLVQQFGEKKAQKIVEADQWFRQNYDQLLNEVNQARARIYPGQPDKIIPKRQDYYRHFREMAEGFAGLKNIFETPSGISSKLAGISYQTEPKSKFLSFAQRRLGMKTDVDAVGGFLDYIKAANYAKHIDPETAKFRALADDLSQATAEGDNAGKLNNFVLFLNRFADDLAGKTNEADRFIQETIPGGRTSMRALTWLNNRVKANVILGNLSSAVAQAGNIPQGIASAGVTNIPKGIARTMAGIVSKDDPINQSTFVKERYFRDFDKFDRGVINNTKKGAMWITSVLDEVGTKLIWNMHYNKALGEGIKNPIKYADDATRSLVAGRGIGEVPLLQKSKMFQLVAPFQLEVGNLWWVMKDMVDEKQFGKLAKLFIASYVFNKVAEQVRGSDVVFDPIQSMMEGVQAFNEEDDKKTGALRLVGRQAGEVLSNAPLGQSIASLYPEYGNKEAGLPTREALFGKGDPTRFGSGLLSTQSVSDPLFKLVPPFGGNQIKKTVQGLTAYGQGYNGSPDAVRYPIAQNVSNLAKTAAFGQYSTPEGREYFDKNRSPLGENQSKVFLGDRSVYNKIMDKREQDKLVDQTRETIKASQSGEKQINDKIVYWDEDAQEVKTTTVKERQKKQLAGEKELIDAQYSLASDQLKRAKDTEGWLQTATAYVDYLKGYKGKISDEADKIRVQDKIETIQAQIDKYQGYGGFSKPKKLPKIAISAPKKIKTFSFKSGSIKPPKLSKPNIQKRKVAVGDQKVTVSFKKPKPIIIRIKNA